MFRLTFDIDFKQESAGFLVGALKNLYTRMYVRILVDFVYQVAVNLVNGSKYSLFMLAFKENVYCTFVNKLLFSFNFLSEQSRESIP